MARKEIKIFMDAKEAASFLKTIDWSWLFGFLSERYNVSLSPHKELKDNGAAIIKVEWPDELIEKCVRRKKLALNPGDLVSLNGEILVVHGTHTKKNGSVNVEFKTPSRGGKKSASLKKLKIVKTSNSMHSAWKKVS